MQFQVPEAMNQVGCHEDSSHARALLSLRFAYGIRYHNLISTMQEAERQMRETTGGGCREKGRNMYAHQGTT